MEKAFIVNNLLKTNVWIDKKKKDTKNVKRPVINQQNLKCVSI